MKYIVIIFISTLLFTFNCKAQDEEETDEIISSDTSSLDREPEHKTISSFDVFYSSKVFNNQFYNSFNQIDHIDFQKPLNEIGFGFTGPSAVGGKYKNSLIPFDGHYSYHMIIPVKVAINDSINSILSGSTMSVSFGRYLLSSFKNFDLIVSGGLDFGRIVLKNANFKTQKNPFFNPTISIQPRVKIKKIVLSVRMDCWNDISKGVWKSTLFSRFSKENSYNINHFRQSGMRFSVGIGYSFN